MSGAHIDFYNEEKLDEYFKVIRHLISMKELFTALAVAEVAEKDVINKYKNTTKGWQEQIKKLIIGLNYDY